ncbi:MAG: ATP synthase F1 subunit delta [Parachlamydiales bacterium]|jgi:F-type H+-transporting ATPase subunit delta
MKDRQSAIQYAKALLKSDSEGNNLRQYQQELEDISGILNHTPGMLKLLDNPQIEHEKRADIIKGTFESSVSPTLLRLMLLLLEKRKLHFLPEITEEFHHMVAQRLGIVEVTVISPWPLSETLRADVKQELEKYSQHEIEIHEEVDPSLLGGISIIMASKMMDFSLQGRLNNLKQILLR